MFLYVFTSYHLHQHLKNAIHNEKSLPNFTHIRKLWSKLQMMLLTGCIVQHSSVGETTKTHGHYRTRGRVVLVSDKQDSEISQKLLQRKFSSFDCARRGDRRYGSTPHWVVGWVEKEQHGTSWP
jgi:hypothetical protein